MSKSVKGSSIDPEDIILGAVKLDGNRKFGYGAEVFRLWSCLHDSDRDMVFDEGELKDLNKQIKDIRRVSRVIVGHLHDYTPKDISPKEFDLIDKLMLLKMFDYHYAVTEAYENLDFAEVYSLAKDFINTEVQDFYLH